MFYPPGNRHHHLRDLLVDQIDELGYHIATEMIYLLIRILLSSQSVKNLRNTLMILYGLHVVPLLSHWQSRNPLYFAQRQIFLASTANIRLAPQPLLLTNHLHFPPFPIQFLLLVILPILVPKPPGGHHSARLVSRTWKTHPRTIFPRF